MRQLAVTSGLPPGSREVSRFQTTGTLLYYRLPQLLCSLRQFTLYKDFWSIPHRLSCGSESKSFHEVAGGGLN